MIVLLLICGCREIEPITPSGESETGEVTKTSVAGFFLLNEGNMGSNKCTLDYYDYETGVYHTNIFPGLNPDVAMELGDVGNDLQIYGDKLYAVVNCSNLVEVMDLGTARHVATISVPSCRYIVFDKGFAYVSSYAGPIEDDPSRQLGYVAKIDTLSMEVVNTCVVGYQPEEMAVADGKLYVANSGGYIYPDYDRTVSVIDLNTFKELKKIDVEVNLHRMEIDRYGKLWVSSRGNYYDIPSMTYIIDTKSDEVYDRFESLSNSEMTLRGDSLLVVGVEWNYATMSNDVSYSVVNVKENRVEPVGFITDGSEGDILVPYGIAVNPDNGDILVTDARDYVTPGKLFCYDAQGRRKWSVTTGDIPSRIAFTTKRLNIK